MRSLTCRSFQVPALLRAHCAPYVAHVASRMTNNSTKCIAGSFPVGAADVQNAVVGCYITGRRRSSATLISPRALCTLRRSTAWLHCVSTVGAALPRHFLKFQQSTIEMRFIWKVCQVQWQDLPNEWMRRDQNHNFCTLFCFVSLLPVQNGCYIFFLSLITWTKYSVSASIQSQHAI